MAQSTNDLLLENFAGGIGTGSTNQTIASTLTGGASGAIQGIGQMLFPEAKPIVNEVALKTGKLLQAQFEDWQNTYMPIELEALNQLSFNNSSVLPTALDEARKTVSDSYGVMGGVLERQNRGLGIVPTRQQEATNKRLININEAAATASAKNRTRAGVRAMDEQILLGTTPNPNIVR
ncbi:MAG: hypothetical protein CVU62_13900 [Deltaproteobacteria bacterium HGW-Deltaproteobacteria-2]|jgi:hypothetical protein|nr:MAG: hypothetical protein CVU62_13900 [Deltaproteobacteria bacterium HGW-Deltaproteobacteria-2]